MSVKAGDRVRITTITSKYKDMLGTVRSAENSVVYVTLDSHPEDPYPFLSDEVAVMGPSEPRVQDAPSEEVQIKTLTERVEDLEGQISRRTEERDIAQRHLENMAGLVEAAAYPYRLIVGTTGDVKVTYYTSESETMQYYRKQSGYRTVEKREGATWTTTYRAWS